MSGGLQLAAAHDRLVELVTVCAGPVWGLGAVRALAGSEGGAADLRLFLLLLDWAADSQSARKAFEATWPQDLGPTSFAGREIAGLFGVFAVARLAAAGLVASVRTAEPRAAAAAETVQARHAKMHCAAPGSRSPACDECSRCTRLHRPRPKGCMGFSTQTALPSA